MGMAINYPVPNRVKQSFATNFFDIRHSEMLSPDCQSARMSKITNDGLTQSRTGFFIAV